MRFEITRSTLTDIVKNFRKRGADTVIDYEHASEFPDAAKGQPIPAAGWFKSLDNGPDEKGILWGSAEFTPRARDLVRSREYKYLSPVIDYDARDKITGSKQGATLLSMAMTNRPFLEAMPAIAMREVDGRRCDTHQMTTTIRVEDIQRLNAAIDGMAARLANPGRLTLTNAMRVLKGQYPDLFAARDALVSGRLAAVEIPYEFSGGVLRATATDRIRNLSLDQAKAAMCREIVYKQSLNPKLSYAEAWKLVASERPDLLKEYNAAANKEGVFVGRYGVERRV